MEICAIKKQGAETEWLAGGGKVLLEFSGQKRFLKEVILGLETAFCLECTDVYLLWE